MAKTNQQGIKPAKRPLDRVVRDFCLGLPESEETVSHGRPDFRVRGKTFATYSINHHGDGRVALLLNSPAGAQQLYTEQDPKAYFVPPYVGPRGWLGIELTQGLPWPRVGQQVVQAYNKVAPKSLQQPGNALDKVKPPSRLPTLAEIDPMQLPAAKSALKKFASLVEPYPEVTQGSQFGTPTWRAGKKTFANFYYHNDGLYFSAWVGLDQQAALNFDQRYHIPAYTGHNGWIALDLTQGPDWDEILTLADQSYRHFALKRMLRVLDGN